MKKQLFLGLALIGAIILSNPTINPIITYASTKKPSSTVVIGNVDGPKYYLSEVTKVVDGDTVDLKFKVWSDIILEKRIRFENIDTWEVKGQDKNKGIAAKDFLIKLLSRGKVYLRTSGATGKYGRTLGSLYVVVDEKIIDVEKELRSSGHEKQE